MQKEPDFSEQRRLALPLLNAGIGIEFLSIGMNNAAKKYDVDSHHIPEMTAAAGILTIAAGVFVVRKKIAHIFRNFLSLR